MSTGKEPQFPNQASAKTQATDPFFSLERILQGDSAYKAQAVASNQYGLPQRSSATHDALSGLRPTMPAATQPKTDPNWGDLEAEIASFTTAQQRVTQDHFKITSEAKHQEPSVPEADVYAQVAPTDPRTKLEELTASNRSRSGMKTIGAIVSIALVGALGVVGYRMVSGGSSSTEPKVIRATNTTAKVAVAPVEQPKSVIDRAPNASAERVVPRDEKPLSPAEQALQNSNARVVQQNPTDDLEPRKVRTVSITPDGATRSQLPTAIPSMAAQTPSSIESAPPKTVKATPISIAAKPVDSAPRVIETPQPVRQTTAAAPKVVAPVQAAPPKVSAPVAPKPTVTATTAKPAAAKKGPMALGPSADSDDETPKQVAAVTPSKVTGGTGSYVVQVGSAESETAAKARFKSLQDKHASLKGRSANFVEAEVNGNTVYRIRLAPTSKEGATEFCSSLKSSGGSCFVASR